MFRLICCCFIVLLAVPVFAETNGKTDEQKTMYAVGMVIAKQLSVFSFTPEELLIVQQGITDVSTGKKPEVDVAAYSEKIQTLARARRKAEGDKHASSGKEFLEKAAHEKGAIKSATGVVYLSLTEGKGDSPKATDTVKVNYRGNLIDGKEFDSSYKRNKPIDFRLDGVIKCWTEGLQLMKPGGKAKLTCPADMAYGENGAGELILPGATLQFEVELLEVKKNTN